MEVLGSLHINVAQGITHIVDLGGGAIGIVSRVAWSCPRTCYWIVFATAPQTIRGTLTDG